MESDSDSTDDLMNALHQNGYHIKKPINRNNRIKILKTEILKPADPVPPEEIEPNFPFINNSDDEDSQSLFAILCPNKYNVSMDACQDIQPITVQFCPDATPEEIQNILPQNVVPAELLLSTIRPPEKAPLEVEMVHQSSVVAPDYDQQPVTVSSSSYPNNEMAVECQNLNQNESDHEASSISSRKRQKHAAPEQWKKNVTKEKRMRGECYLGYKRDANKIVTTDIPKPEREMGPACFSAFCLKSSKRFCYMFAEDMRVTIFENFWKELDWSGKHSLISSLVDKVPTKQKRSQAESKVRKDTLVYYLKLNGESYQVCKIMFLNTFGLKERMVYNWVSFQTTAGIPSIATKKLTSARGKKRSTHIPNDEGLTQNYHLNKFFDDIPKLPSHYCRSSSSKLYLEPVFKNKSHVYDVYKEKCNEDNVVPVSLSFFLQRFDELNLSIYKPKKDKCDLCCGYEAKNVTQDVYDQHVKKKKAAREEKETDKNLAIERKITVLCMDVQSVKICPKLEASAIYFKMKLCCHNYTVYNMATHEVVCFWWHECEGDLQASNFASCLVNYILEKVPKTLPLIIYSDGCTAQNRNAIMANALLDLSIKEKMHITQKYLEKGHTQMECDSVHSVIELKLRNTDIFLPHQYATVTKKAKRQDPKYEAKYLTYNFFNDYSQLKRYTSIRPGKKPGDPTVTDIRQINYEPHGIIKYKLNFSDELKLLPYRPKPINDVVKRMYSERVPIKLRKYKDLQDLKAVIPIDCHSFYDNLPKTDD